MQIHYTFCMIYLIGGAPRAGKSIVSKRLVETTGAIPISTDSLRKQVVKSLSPEAASASFPYVGFSAKAAENNITPESRIALMLTDARSLASAIEDVVAEAMKKNQNMVIEGVHLLPAHVHALAEKYGSEKVRAAFLGSTDAELMVAAMEKFADPDAWLAGSPREVQRQVAEFVVACSDYTREEAMMVGLPYLERTGDFYGDVERMVALVTK